MRTRVTRFINKILTLTILLFILSNSLSAISNKEKQVLASSISKCLDCSDIKLTDGTGFFDVAQDENGVWWFVTPTGEKFYSTGCTYVDLDNLLYRYNVLDKYGDSKVWANITIDRLKTWGINTVSGLNSREFFPDMPYVARFRFKQINTGKGWTSQRHPDVFDPAWQKAVEDIINEFAVPLKEDSNLIGYYTDNEMQWGADQGPVNDIFLTILELYMSAPKETPGKQRVVQFMSERYNNINEFNRVWRMNIDNFHDLFNYTKFGRDAWCIRLGQAKKDVDDFSRLVANTYFKIASSTLKAADPNHLYLGVRFHPMGVPREVLEECAKYVDVISINYYRNLLNIYDPAWMYYELLFDCVPYDQWLQRYYKISNKPILISEFNFILKDYDTSINSQVSKKSLKVCPSPEKEAEKFERYTRKCLDCPYIIGYHWFVYTQGYFCNWGLVNFWDEPNTPLVDKMAEINNKAIELHQKSGDSSFNKRVKTYDFSFIKRALSSCSNLLKPKSQNVNKLNEKFMEEVKDFSFNSIAKNNYLNIYDNIIYVDDEPGEGLDNPYENFTNIQNAIDNSSNGDTIFVYNGIYNEEIKINKSINLVGESSEETIINGCFEQGVVAGLPQPEYKNIVITVLANNVNITGFNITDKTGKCNHHSARSCSGIFLLKCDKNNIFGNIFFNLGLGGIIAIHSNNNILSNNIFCNTFISGIILDNSTDNIVENNNFLQNHLYSTFFLGCKNTLIKNNIIKNGDFIAMSLLRSHNNEIIKNSIIYNKEMAITFRDSNNNKINQNNFIGNGANMLRNIMSTIFLYNSKHNNWNRNYWNDKRIIPKAIYGREELDSLTRVIDFDIHPAREPYIPIK
jgi:parallel beta-helix repeat protein